MADCIEHIASREGNSLRVGQEVLLLFKNQKFITISLVKGGGGGGLVIWYFNVLEELPPHYHTQILSSSVTFGYMPTILK
jgi:hypothetical protein